MQTSLSNLQQELLKIYAHNVTEQQLYDIKVLLAQYFAKQAIQEVDKIWGEHDFSQDIMDKWLNE